MASGAEAAASWWLRGSRNDVCSALIVVGVPVALGLLHVAKMVRGAAVALVRGDGPDGRADELCSICLDALRLAVATDCGHTFCGQCLKQAFRRKPRGERANRCPLCRRYVYSLTTRFSEQERLATPWRQRDAVGAFVAAYNSRHSSGVALLRELVTDISFALQSFRANFNPEQDELPHS